MPLEISYEIAAKHTHTHCIDTRYKPNQNKTPNDASPMNVIHGFGFGFRLGLRFRFRFRFRLRHWIWILGFSYSRIRIGGFGFGFTWALEN